SPSLPCAHPWAHACTSPSAAGTFRLDSRPPSGGPMAKNSTFDITSTIDLQEADNAINQARKEIAQRYDFKGSGAEVEYDKSVPSLTLLAAGDYRLKSLGDVVQPRLIKRGVPIRNRDYGEVEP